MSIKKILEEIILTQMISAMMLLQILISLDQRLLIHTTTPRPGATHEYLEIDITKKSNEEHVHLKKLMMFFPDALKDIAESFKLPIHKGDFSHRFNSVFRDEYLGAFPPINTVENYFCLQTKKIKRRLKSYRCGMQQNQRNIVLVIKLGVLVIS